MSDFLHFPKDFLWGAATASYQIEGGAFEDGRTESIWDRFSRLPGKVRNGATGDIACDHYHLWKSDIDLMAHLGLKAYRYSISWSRVLPEGRGKPNQKGLDFYSHLTDGLLEKGIEPFITLFHWDLPMVIQDAGGWLNRRTIDWFVEYAELMYKTLGDRVKLWATLNEPNAFVYCGFISGKHAPGVKDNATAAQVAHHLLVAHGDAVKAGRSILSHAEFGLIPAIGMVYPANDTPDNRAYVENIWRRDTGAWLDPVFKGTYPLTPNSESQYPVILPGDMERIAEPIDFLGINHYSSTWFVKGSDGEPLQVPVNLPQTDREWTIYPDGFKDMLLKVTAEYGKIPIYITENGASNPDTISSDGMVHDQLRGDYYKGYLTALHQAISKGVDVRGYFAWSFLDNFEWEEGYSSRFGIVYVDFDTLRRTIKDSGIMYAKIINDNGL